MRHFRVILPFTLLLFSLACLKDNPLGIDQGFSQIHVTIGLPEVGPVSSPDTALDKVAAFYTVILTVTADDMETIEEELDISSDGKTASGTVQVPKGEERTFTIVIKDQDDITRFEGSNTVDVLKGSKTVTIVAIGLYSNVTVNVNILAKQLNPSGPTNSLSKIVVVTNVVLSVSASDMETIEAYLNVGSGGETASGTADVPKGNNRTFEVLCKDANDVVQYSGSTTQDVLAATATVSITTEGHYPAASTLSITEITSSAVTLAWTQNTDTDFQAYDIYRSLSAGVDINSDFITTISSPSTVSYIDNTVSRSTTYYYRVRVTDTEDLDSWSNEVSGQTLAMKDGHWSGKTNKNKDISFDVINQGTQIDEGLKIIIYFVESWGYGTVTITMKIPLDINDNKFTYSESGFSIDGTFENTTHCTGNYSLSSNTGYPYYLPISAAGTWTADWESAATSLAKHVVDPELIEGIEQYIEKIVDNNSIKITLHLFK